MGQYYVPVNLRKKEYLYPHTFGDGPKLLEFGCSAYGMMTGLAILLADGNGRGGGDLYLQSGPQESIVGRWAGDPIVISGDYADEGKFVANNLPNIEGRKATELNLFEVVNSPEAGFKDISLDVLWAMWDNEFIQNEYDPDKTKNPRSRHDTTLELIKLKKTPVEDWPLLIGKLKTDEVKNFFECTLRKRYCTLKKRYYR